MAAHPSLSAALPRFPASRAVPLKRTDAFRAVYRRGRWVRGALLSLGVLPTGAAHCRIGLRTRRGLKGAVVRNRLKRQLRGLLAPPRGLALRAGVDVVIVAHPGTPSVRTDALQQELATLCRKAKILS